MITELSICRDQGTRGERDLPGEEDYLFPRNSGHQAVLESLMESIRTLRLSKIDIRLDDMSFQALVELRIEDVMLGHNMDFFNLFYVLSSAPELRILQIIDVVTIPDSNDSTITDPRPPDYLCLPKLETLDLQDLYFDVMRVALKVATPPCCRLVLRLTARCLLINHNYNPKIRVSRTLTQFKSMLSKVGAQVDTLMIGVGSMDWLGGASGLHQLLLGMERLKTLYLHRWELD